MTGWIMSEDLENARHKAGVTHVDEPSKTMSSPFALMFIALELLQAWNLTRSASIQPVAILSQRYGRAKAVDVIYLLFIFCGYVNLESFES